jgi:hypothetical protein
LILKDLFAFAAQTGLVEHAKSALSLFRSQPVADPCAVLFHSSFTRRIPAARSGLNSPQSTASYASRRTAAKRRLMVDDA